MKTRFMSLASEAGVVRNVGLNPTGEKRVIEGDAFIVPNSLGVLENFLSPEGLMKILRQTTGVLATYEDRMLQIWVTNSDCDNWSDHYRMFNKICGMKEGQKQINFPGYFPARLFKDKKEGDVIILHSKEYDVEFRITLRQLKYRHKSFGTFEETYKKLIRE